jgi:peptidyl-tRNA hydrolase
MNTREAFLKFYNYEKEVKEGLRKIVSTSRFGLSAVVEVYDQVKDLKLVQEIIKTADEKNLPPINVVCMGLTSEENKCECQRS